MICQNCGWQNGQENSYCHDCGKELEDDRIDDTQSESDGDATESTEPTLEDDTGTIGLGTDVIEAAAYVASIPIGCLLGLWLLFNGEIMLAGMTWLAAIGWPFLLTEHGRYMTRRGLGLSRSSRHNEPSESTKQCLECGWHNYRSNNNCVECDTEFPE